MSTETIAAPGAAAELLAPESQENLEVANQETGEEPKQEETDPVKALEERLEKERKAFQRRMDRKHQRDSQEIANARAEAQMLRDQLQRATPKTEGEQTQQLSPEKVQELIKQEAARLSQEQSFSDRVGRVLESGKRLPDFDSLVNTVADEIPLQDGKGQPTTFLRAVLDADKPHELLAYLGKNPDLLDDLHGLSEGQMARRLDRIEQGIKQEPKPSKAPTPLKPASGSQGSNGTPSPDSDDYLSWKLGKLQGK